MDRKLIWSDDFSDLERWMIRKHEHGQVVNDIHSEERKHLLAKAFLAADNSGCRLKYKFKTSGNDAVMITRGSLDIRGGMILSIEVNGDGLGGKFFVVLTEGSGEKHIFQTMPLIDWHGVKHLTFNIDSLRQPQLRGVVDSFHWEGDGNQSLNDPITAITIGISTPCDSCQMEGEIQLSRLEITAEKP